MIDASGFVGGPVTLISGGGLDTLRGSAQNDEYRVDVDGLATPDPTDATTQITVNSGGGNDEIVILNFGDLSQDDLDWVRLDTTGPGANAVGLTAYRYHVDQPVTYTQNLALGGKAEIKVTSSSKLTISGAKYDAGVSVIGGAQLNQAGNIHHRSARDCD